MIVLDLDFSSKDYSVLTVDGDVMTDDAIEIGSDATIVRTFQKQKVHTYEIQLPCIGWVVVTADPKKSQSQIDLKVFDTDYKGKGLKGLCGNMDGSSSNDNSAAIVASCMSSLGLTE